MAKQIIKWECDHCKKLYDEEKIADDCCHPDEYTMRKEYCPGCESNFYNGNNEIGVKKCWSLSTARLILRKEVHINHVPPWNQAPKWMPNCYHKKQFVYVGPDQTQ